MTEPKITMHFVMKEIARKKLQDVEFGEAERKSLEKFFKDYSIATEKYLKNHHITGVISVKFEYD